MIPANKSQREYAIDAIKMLLENVNVMGSEKPITDGVLEALSTGHRTLNQNFWRMMVGVIREYAKFHYDLRNEASVELCQFLTEKLDEYEKQNDGKRKDFLPNV
jgi:hypothetical protein